MENKQLITFLDHIGRCILAEHVETTETRLTVKNPVILHAQPTPQGQLNIQTLPLYFREFLGEKTKETGSVWSYSLNSVVLGVDIDNDARLVQAYHNLWVPQQAAPAQPQGSPKVVKLFDDEETK